MDPPLPGRMANCKQLVHLSGLFRMVHSGHGGVAHNMKKTNWTMSMPWWAGPRLKDGSWATMMVCNNRWSGGIGWFCIGAIHGN